MEVHYSSNTTEWETPQNVFDALELEFGFTLDPCCTKENAKCKKHFTKEHDGLSRPWTDEVVFMNPPYGGEISKWMRKAYAATHEGATVVCLVPARTDTKWWHDYAMKGEVRLLRGRLKFGNAKTNAPFPSAIIVLRPINYKLVQGL